MIRGIRNALILYGIVAVWAWWFGAVGFVAGGIAFLGGWAIGHRTGRHDAEREQVAAFRRYWANREEQIR